MILIHKTASNWRRPQQTVKLGRNLKTNDENIIHQFVKLCFETQSLFETFLQKCLRTVAWFQRNKKNIGKKQKTQYFLNKIDNGNLGCETFRKMHRQVKCHFASEEVPIIMAFKTLVVYQMNMNLITREHIND